MATESPELNHREISWLRAACHAKRFPSMRFGMVGGWFGGMAHFHLDSGRLCTELGPTLIEIGIPECEQDE